MKKIMTILMSLAMALCVSSVFVSSAAAQGMGGGGDGEYGVIDCQYDWQCDNGLDLYCSSQPRCIKRCERSDVICELEDMYGTCMFEDPCAIYPESPNCNPESTVWGIEACVECTNDMQCNQPPFPGDGQYCLDNNCVECIEDDQCDSDAVCENNECIECDTDSDCDDNSNGDFCVEGSCEECVVTADCPNPWETCEENECVGDPECDSDSDCRDSETTDYPETFCAPYQYCTDQGTCDNSSNVCEAVWGMEASACVEEDRKCTACLYNADGSGDTTCQNDWENLANGWGYPVNVDWSPSSPGYERYSDGVFDNATGPICTEGGDCVACVVDTDCPSNFCEGSATCDAEGNLSERACEFVDEEYDPCDPTPETPVCDETNDRCVECLWVNPLVILLPDEVVDDDQASIIGPFTPYIVGDCAEPSNFCNGTITCNEMGNGECGLSGNPCPRTCLPDAEKCDDCKSDADCVADDVIGGDFEGKPICQTSNEFDEDTNSCTECKQDSDCADGQVCDLDEDYEYSGIVIGNTSACVDCMEDEDCIGNADGELCIEGFCGECNDSGDCPTDMPRCRVNNSPVDGDMDSDTDHKIIVVGPDAVSNGGPPGVYDNCVVAPSDDNVCVECFDGYNDCPPELPHCLLDTCAQYADDMMQRPKDGVANALIVGIQMNICVECRDNNDCWQPLEGETACLRDGVCDNESWTCSYTNPCGDKTCYPAGYYPHVENQNTVPEVIENNEVYFFCADCVDDASCDDGAFCNGVETCDGEGSCAAAAAGPCAEGQLCDEAADECLDVECLEDSDCLFFQTCDALNECADVAATCGMKINPKKVKADKIVDGKQKLTIKGIKGQSFDPNAEIYFSDAAIQEPSGSVTVKKDKRKSLLQAVGVIDEGTTLTIRLGDCEGTVEIK